MAIFTVTNLDDSGSGSLRDAIGIANETIGADTIEFANNLSGGVIGLTSGELKIKESLTINGLGANFLKVDAQKNNFRVFNINDNNTLNLIDVFINGLTITGGNALTSNGSGIFNEENLTVTNSIITDNTSGFGGGGIDIRNGIVNITNSIITNNSANSGGGIGGFNSTVNITNSNISSNFAREGGGIDVSGSSVDIINSTISENFAGFTGGGLNIGGSSANITNSTISRNTASFSGGGLHIPPDGMNVVGSTVNIINSTISGNTATSFFGGGLNVVGSTVNISNNTISGNSAGFENSLGGGGGLSIFNFTDFGDFGPIILDGTVNITNTIIANSTGGDCVNFSGTIASNINNLIEDGTCNPQLSGTPNIGPLQVNGGSTETHALLPGSIAINTGSNEEVPPEITTDQRGLGFVRIVNGTVDIGAFEVQSAMQSVPESSSVLASVVLFTVGFCLFIRKKFLKIIHSIFQNYKI